MKNTIRLTENQLHRVIRESVKRVINEMENEGFRDSFSSGYNSQFDPQNFVGGEYVNGDYGDEGKTKFGRFKDAMGYRLGAATKNLKNGRFSKINPMHQWKTPRS